ncbi:hypothetical protein TSAR_005112 [Trichomalopsis sarcophagae]|uniref:Uncharacterized protein n=1 Tax=Trichomalopsis sarcophagae TaxID=543379 RepID=A0A232F2V3_9HYME|nr:hypothetical protein TSAR_005112 [Trichomalopsis sarcophagae]
MDDDQTFAIVELNQHGFRCILTAWMDKVKNECILPDTHENAILQAIQSYRKPNDTWSTHTISGIHRYADDLEEALSLLRIAKLGVAVQDKSLNTLANEVKQSRKDRAKKRLSYFNQSPSRKNKNRKVVKTDSNLKDGSLSLETHNHNSESISNTVTTSSPILSSNLSKRKGLGIQTESDDVNSSIEYSQELEISKITKKEAYDFDAAKDTDNSFDSILGIPEQNVPGWFNYSLA